MTPLPGTRVLALAERLFDRGTIDSIIVPTVADMRHEVGRAGPDRLARSAAVLRGYAAVGRVLVRNGLLWRCRVRFSLTVFLLGILGSALLLGVARVAPGPESAGALVAMGILASIVLRLTQRGGSYVGTFLSCAAIGMMMGTTWWLWAAATAPGPLPWYAYVLGYAFLAGCVGFGSALAAAAAWRPAHESLMRRRMVHVLVAAAAFLAAEAVMYVFAFRRAVELSLIGWLLFLSFYFAAVTVAVYLPTLLGIRRFLSNLAARAALPLVGAVLFPVPLLGLPLLQGRLGTTWEFLVHHPGALATTGAPYAVAGALLGWLLAAKPFRRGRGEVQAAGVA